jgi:hypothetical protein
MRSRIGVFSGDSCIRGCRLAKESWPRWRGPFVQERDAPGLSVGQERSDREVNASNTSIRSVESLQAVALRPGLTRVKIGEAAFGIEGRALRPSLCVPLVRPH